MKDLELKYNRKQILPLDLQYNTQLDNVDIDTSIKRQYKNIFSYQIILIIKNINQNSKEIILKELIDYIKSLDKNKIYSILPHLYSNKRSQINAIFDKATFVCYRSSPEALTNLIIQGIIKYENKYIINSSYQLIITHRIWLDKNSLISPMGPFNNEIFDKIQNEYIIPSILPDKTAIGVYPVCSKYVKKKLRLIRKNTLHLELTPNIINNLPIITGDFSFTLREINLPKFNNHQLLTFYHENISIHSIIENNLDIMTFIDEYKNDSTIIRKDYFNSNFEFNNSNLVITESQFKLDYINQIGIEKIKDLNIGIIEFKTFTVNNEGLQEV